MIQSHRQLSTFAATLVLLWIGWVGISPAAAEPGAETPEIRTQVSENGIDIQITLGDHAVSSEQLDLRAYDVLSFEGQNGVLKAPGAPEMPVIDLIIGVPAVGSITLEVDAQAPADLGGGYNLVPASIPSPLEQDLAPGKMTPGELSLPGSAGDAQYPSEQVTIAGEAWVRGQRIVRLQVSPFHYDAATQSVSFTPGFDLHVKFTEPQAGGCLNCDYDAEFEQVLSDQLVNYEQSRAWRIPSGSPEMRELIQSPLTSTFLGPRYEIVVDQDGVYRLTYADMQAAGMDVDNVDPRKFKLFNHGSEVRIRVVGESDGVFNPDDSILFYGEKFRGDILEARYQSSMTRANNDPNNPDYAANNWFWQCLESCELASYFERYTDDNVYYLLNAAENGLRMAEMDATPAGAAIPAFFTTTVRAEESNAWWSHEFYDDDIWFWGRNELQAGYPITSSYPAQLSGVAGGSHTANIYLEFATRSGSTLSNAEYHTKFSINGQLLSDTTWDGARRFSLSVDFPQNNLLSGTNSLLLEILDPGILVFKPDLYFDFYEITYARNFGAVGDRLSFTYDQAGAWRYQVSGLTSASVEALEISDPFNPVRLKNVASINNGGSYTADFQVTTASESAFIVAGTGSGILTPKKVAAYSPPDFEAMAPADYILITHSDFLTSTQVLADYRAAQGHSVAVIDVNDLYHEFNDGIYHPIAIKNFLAYAFANWPTPPLYVTLVGNGNWNMKNVGDGSRQYHNAPTTYMPPNLAYIDPWQGEVDSANLLATVIGDDTIPDVYIARIPVNTDSQMAAVVSKITGYESAPLTGWHNNVLFIADNVPDPKYAGDFVWLSEGIISDYLANNPPHQALRIYQDTGGIYPNLPDYDCTSSGGTPAQCTNVRNAIVNTFNTTGTVLVNYTGHANLDRWSNESIFLTSTVDLLTNASQLPVILSLTCLDGHWTYPNIDSLAYRFLTRAGGGAVATFSPTGLGVATGHDYLQRGFYDSLFSDGNWELGPATMSAKINLWGSGWDYDLMHTFILFGDPATGVRNPNVSVSPTEASASAEVGLGVDYLLTIQNTGSGTDVFDVLVSSPSWTTTPVTTTVGPLDAGQTAPVTVTVNVPGNAFGNQIETTVVTVTSRADVNRQAAAQLTTTAVLPEILLTPIAALKSGLRGETLQFSLAVTNASLQSDTFGLTVDGPGGWTVNAPVSVGPVASNGTANFNVAVTIPFSAAFDAEETFTVKLTSQKHPEHAAVSSLTVQADDSMLFLPIVIRK